MCKSNKDGLQTYCKDCRKAAYNSKRDEICQKRNQKYKETHLKDFEIPEGYSKCSVCGEIKPLIEFGKGSNKNGARSNCKECRKKAYWENRDAEIEANHRNYEKHKEARQEQAKKYKFEHSEWYKNYSREYYKANSEKIKAMSAEQYKHLTEEQKAHRKEYAKEYNSTEHGKKIKAVHSEKRRAMKHNADLGFTLNDWESLIKEFNGECAYCGTKCKPTQDHIIPLINGGMHTKSNIVPACSRCNSSKHASDVGKWYKKQPFFSQEKYEKIILHIGE